VRGSTVVSMLLLEALEADIAAVEITDGLDEVAE
jgi:hypothetical protein